jgi:HEAT repeat protein
MEENRGLGEADPAASERNLLLEMLAHGTAEEQRRAAQSLDPGSSGEVVKSLITAATGAREWSVREQSVLALRGVPDARAVAALRQLVGGRRRDRDARVRAAAALALSSTGSGETVSALLGMLSERAREPRRAAALALGRLRAPAALLALADLARASDPALRLAAVWSLGQIGVPRGESHGRAALVRALGDDEWRIRRVAAEGLGRRSSPADVRPLLAALEDSRPEVRQEAAVALGRLGSADALPALRNRRAVWRELNGSVRAACRDAVARVEAFLRGQPPEVVPAPAPAGSGLEVSPEDRTSEW